MRTRAVLAVVAAFLFAALAVAADAWHPSLEKGLESAKRTGKPVFVVTLWPPGV